MAAFRRLVPIVSVIAAFALGLFLVKQGSSWLSFVGLTSGAIWVLLSTRASVWNFPVGLLNAAIMAYDLFRQSIYADSTLYAIFFIQLAWGWWQWTHGGPDSSPRQVARVPWRELKWVAVSVAAIWAIAWYQLRLLSGYYPGLDGLGFAASIGSQYLLDRKYVESWPGWVGVNVLYASIYIAKGLWPYTVLSVILLAMSFVGWSEWAEKIGSDTADTR